MSLRFEQQRSLFRTREFLRRLLARPMLKPKDIRDMASRCLRHYPFLDSKGAPMFSQDDFECPVISDALYKKEDE